MTWSNGRQLDSTNVGGMNLSYSYNADGQRTSKSRSAYYTDEYVYYGTQLSTLIRNGVGYKHSLTFIYDDNGQALGFYYDTNLNDSNPGTKYYYVCNAQGDVLQLRDHTNAPVANYYYDTWGKLLGITDANGNAITASNHVAVLNPIRYRGYFYDTETGFYYLNSRYYDPQIGRFINADGFVSTGQSFLGYNMFAYCSNNPVMLSDPTGYCIKSSPCGGVEWVACDMPDDPSILRCSNFTKEQLTELGFGNCDPFYLSPPIVVGADKSMAEKEQFVHAVYQRGQKDEGKTGIPAALMAAQASWESRYGSSNLAINNNNLFGLSMNGKSFSSIDDCILYYENLLSDPYGSYAYLHGQTLEGWVNGIGAVYAPDSPNYAQSLWAVIKLWDLE